MTVPSVRQYLRMSIQPFDLALAAIFLASVALILMAQEPWLKVLYDIAVGSLISLIFYVLVVRLPDYQRRKRIKRSFAKQYKRFREDCIRDILSVADRTFDSDLIDRLMEQSQFSEYFRQKVSSSQDRWNAFENNLDEYNLRELMVNMEIFRDEIAFVLNNTDISKDEAFDFLKQLSSVIASVKATTTLDYDGTKRLSRFLWEVLAGFNFVTGYRQDDIIEEMIKSI
jgi:hypothetical protein